MIQRTRFGIPSLERGCRHLGVRQSEDKSNGTRDSARMQVDFEGGTHRVIGPLAEVGFQAGLSQNTGVDPTTENPYVIRVVF